MFVTTAYAQSASQGAMPGTDMLVQMLPFILIFVVFYFLLLRPQTIKLKQQKAMLEALQKGDRIVTAGGIIGTVYKIVDANEVIIEIAPEIRVRVVRSTITSSMTEAETSQTKPVKVS
jgi:preprotein translocase subunit YajC